VEKEHPLKASLRSREKQWSKTSAGSNLEKHKWPLGGSQGEGGRKKEKLETSGAPIVWRGHPELQQVREGEAAR